MRVLQNGCASGDNRLLGIQTIAEVMGDHFNNRLRSSSSQRY
jgi:hypothetical protein